MLKAVESPQATARNMRRGPVSEKVEGARAMSF
jgi:hypothetical protein